MKKIFIDRTRVTFSAEMIKMLMIVLAKIDLSPEELLMAEDDSQKIREGFEKIFAAYKKK